MSRHAPLVVSARSEGCQRARASAFLLMRAYVAIASLAWLHDNLNGTEPRWQKTTAIITALVLLSAAVLPVAQWRRLRVIVGGMAALLLSVSGVVSGVSIEEGFDLVATAILLSGCAWILGLPERQKATRRADAMLRALTELQAEIAGLRAGLWPLSGVSSRPRPSMGTAGLDGALRAEAR